MKIKLKNLFKTIWLNIKVYILSQGKPEISTENNKDSPSIPRQIIENFNDVIKEFDDIFARDDEPLSHNNFYSQELTLRDR